MIRSSQFQILVVMLMLIQPQNLQEEGTEGGMPEQMKTQWFKNLIKYKRSNFSKQKYKELFQLVLLKMKKYLRSAFKRKQATPGIVIESGDFCGPIEVRKQLRIKPNQLIILVEETETGELVEGKFCIQDEVSMAPVLGYLMVNWSLLESPESGLTIQDLYAKVLQ